ncbi:MAG: UTP--glucose-1-phosphate uridylyltransferase [Candidatus Aeolococcus gillhamiae]|uniref:UTP--glucose-1-phosphate uridylyltransferase n=1 Tax=Candidatus Aeolococcus gillhamiae TaxID=3127015 RepID=A0A2W6AEW3_9BACT|nr:MAG: UTP--glucose-1-phosphate uridylyltransferase [Candidatus Dormibacter sp. RRmetagenome_bin12]
MDLRHCVIPAAGLGTRFLPATKALPKELLPVLDRPVIQWGVEEAVAAGAGEIVVVISEGKELIQEHFSVQPELEALLQKRGKLDELEAVRASDHMASFTWVRQDEPLGLGHAVLCAADAVGDRPFLCMLPDDLSYGPDPVLRQLVDAYREHQTPILALMRVPRDQISRYGCAAVVEFHGRIHRVSAVVEKPKAEDAPSDLAIMGRYVLTPNIFEALRSTQPGAGGEIQLTDGIATLLDAGAVHGVEFTGELLDVGTPAGWLATNARLAMDDPTLAVALRAAVEVGAR